MVKTKNLIIYALIGGVLSGIMSSLPLIKCCNIFCCFWVILGGALSAFLLSKKEKIELKDGAVVGALSGVIGGVIATVVSIIFDLIGQTFLGAWGLGSGGLSGMPGMGFLGTLGIVIVFAITLVIYILLGIIFGAAGGIIAVKLLEKKASEPPKPVEKKVEEKKEEKIVSATIQNADVNAAPKTGEPKLSEYKA